MDQFLTYQTFITATAAQDIVQVLQENNVPFEFDNANNMGSKFFEFNTGTQQLELKLRKEDFSKADRLIEQTAVEQIPLLTEDYHIFAYNKDELTGIVSEPDKWNKFDYYIAKHLLLTRYNDVTPGQLEQLKEQRLEELSKPDTSTPSLIRFRYLFALAGVPGIILGLVIYTHKKTLPNGENVYVYSYDSRKKALVVIAISTLFLLLYICMALYRHLSNSY